MNDTRKAMAVGNNVFIGKFCEKTFKFIDVYPINLYQFWISSISKIFRISPSDHVFSGQ